MSLNLPPPDHTQLPRAALPLVVCQVRFDEQPAVGEATLGRPFLEAVRTDYPTPTQLRAEQLTVVSAPGTTEAATTHRKGWRAASVDAAWSISLLPDSVSLETSAFTSFAEMEIRLERLLQVTEDLVSPALSERIGLRFVNLLPLLGDGDIAASQIHARDWAKVLREPLRGLANDEVLELGLLMMDARAILDGGDGIKAGVRWAFGGTDRVLLDLDVFRDAAAVFSVDTLVAEARRCNDLAVQLFYASVSPETLTGLSGLNS